MSRTVLVEQTVRDTLRRLPPAVKRRIKRGLAELSDVGQPPERGASIKRLDAPDHGEPVYRLRVGDYRCVFVVRATEVRVVRVFHREEGYGWLDRLDLD